MKYIIAFILIFNFQIGKCCSCNWAGDFLEVCNKASLIVMVEVKRYNISARGAKIKILETYKGKSATSITVWGDNGIQCRPYIQSFKPKGIYIFAINKSRGKGYYLSNCGEYFLSVKDKKVKSLGRSTKRKKRLGEMDLDEFLGRLKVAISS